jgi:hypothetical protein
MYEWVPWQETHASLCCLRRRLWTFRTVNIHRLRQKLDYAPRQGLDTKTDFQYVCQDDWKLEKFFSCSRDALLHSRYSCGDICSSVVRAVTTTGPDVRAVKGVSLRPLDCLDREVRSRWGSGPSSLTLVVCRVRVCSGLCNELITLPTNPTGCVCETVCVCVCVIYKSQQWSDLLSILATEPEDNTVAYGLRNRKEAGNAQKGQLVTPVIPQKQVKSVRAWTNLLGENCPEQMRVFQESFIFCCVRDNRKL